MSDRPVLLLVEDEKNTREGLARALQSQYTVLLAEQAARALELLEEQRVDIMLTDLRMPGMDGMTLMRRALARTPAPVVILLTAYGNIELAVQAMKNGAYDFMTKPVNLDRLDLVLKRALKARDMEAENRDLRAQLDDKFGLEQLVGRSPAMHEVFEVIKQVAPSRATVLIQGESGTGKELVAHAVHRLSPRAQGPFVAVHCAALSPHLLESELFGHEKGAFTGATGQRQGRFEMADGGTLFLDEIGEIDPSVQIKILRVLEERQFERVGGQEKVEVDVRLVAATNRDLQEMVEDGDFREDLFYRLYVVAVSMPPLRERVGDIPLLVRHFLKIFAEENDRQIEGLTPDALEALAAYDWPGNVRELRNAVERMVVMSKGPRLTLRDVPATLRTHPSPGGSPSSGSADALSMAGAERAAIAKALKACGGNRTQAARQLGISRRTLHRKLNEYGLRDAI